MPENLNYRQKFSKKQKLAHLKNSNGSCPFCKSQDIEGDGVEVEGTSAYQECSCSECGRRWKDIYALTNVEELDI